MLYYLHLLSDLFSPLRVFRYITVRSVCGAGTAFLLMLFLMPRFIRWLRALRIRQYEHRADAPSLAALHAKKDGTPTMGGLLLIACVSLSALLWGQISNLYLWLALATFCFMGLIGAYDDFKKITGQSSKGLSARRKFALQALWALVALVILALIPETRDRVRQLMVPFIKDPFIADMGWIGAFLFLTLVLVGASNAVNLTDGLDGLAIGCSSSVAISYLVMSYAAGHVAFAEYLNVPYVKGSGELAVFCGCLLGGGLGFLWYNCHPASVFMGDTGSLAIGGALAMVAILIKQEVALIVVGGVFVMEAVSVILQVGFFKWKRRRIFAMAPIHHHFQLRQWSETQVTIRFWILSIICALLGILMLKIR
jgi:phospho-N-acetylmuramoyl-pentapeptide-transferase